MVIDSCLHDSTTYFSDHEKLLKCNPYCRDVTYLMELDIFQWIFQVSDPRNNPITAVFFVRQHEEIISPYDSYGQKYVSRLKSGTDLDGKGKRIRWEAVREYPKFDTTDTHTFIGNASSEICLLHQKDNRTAVFFETDIALDFDISFPLNLMPEGILKFMTETIMSQIMQKATESMLCKVQADICCCSTEPVVVGAKK